LVQRQQVKSSASSKFIGKDGAQSSPEQILKAAEPKSGMIATIVGSILLHFVELQRVYNLKALNTIWNVSPPPRTRHLRFLQDRILSFAMILGIGFLLLVSFSGILAQIAIG